MQNSELQPALSPSLGAFGIWKERAGAPSAERMSRFPALCKQPCRHNPPSSQRKGARVRPPSGRLGRAAGCAVRPGGICASAAWPNEAETAGAAWAVLSQRGPSAARVCHGRGRTAHVPTRSQIRPAAAMAAPARTHHQLPTGWKRVLAGNVAAEAGLGWS